VGGLLLIGLFIVLAAKLWPFLLVGLVALLLWWFVIAPQRAARTRDTQDRMRHERARADIDRIALATQRQMFEAARQHGDIIDGTATEVDND
jgi:uncharacterized membrane protein